MLKSIKRLGLWGFLGQIIFCRERFALFIADLTKPIPGETHSRRNTRTHVLWLPEQAAQYDWQLIPHDIRRILSNHFVIAETNFANQVVAAGWVSRTPRQSERELKHIFQLPLAGYTVSSSTWLYVHPRIGNNGLGCHLQRAKELLLKHRRYDYLVSYIKQDNEAMRIILGKLGNEHIADLTYYRLFYKFVWVKRDKWR